MKYLINKKINIFILALFISIIPNITKAAFIGASAPVTATTSCNTGLSCGLVGYWTFDGKDISNGVLLDKSGNNISGNLINIASTTFFSPGKIGQAFRFDGVNDHINLSSSTTLNNGNWTVSVWARLSGNNAQHILTNQNNGPVVNALGIYTSKMLYYHYNGSWITDTGNVIVANNMWHLLTWVNHSDQTMDMYVDGVLDASGLSSSVVSTGPVNRIGSGYGAPPNNNFVNGYIDDLRVYNRALSAQEIKQLYNIAASNKIGSTAVASSTNACTTGISCGLVGYWTFDGKDIVNGVILDKSGTGNNGNPVSIASSTFYAPGKIGQGVSFDGVTANVAVPDNTSLKPSGSMSWGGWVYQKTTSINQSFLSKVTTGTQGYMIYNSANSSTLCFAYGLTPSSLSDALGAVQTNRWVHYMCVYDGSTLKLYRNGALLSSVSVTGSITHSTNQLNIGSYNSNNRFVGLVDEVRVYNRALSAQEVQQLYSMGGNNKLGSSATASSTTACTVGLACGLVGYWTFDGKDINTNGVLLDKSGNGKNAYKVNISTTTLNAPGKIGQGANFDGVGYVSVGDNLDLIGSPFTLSAWIYPQSYSGTSSNSPGVIDKLGTAGNYRLNVSLGLVTFGIRSSDNTFEGLSGTGNSAPLFKWTHVVVTYDNVATGKIYVNGVLNNSKTNFTVSRGDTAVPLLIGSNNNNPNSNFKGKIDDVRIYNRVLSDKEIQQLYSQSR